MCRINQLVGSQLVVIRLVGWLGLLTLTTACRHRISGLPLDRIAIVGASVSAGFGGTPFGDAFAAAAPHAVVESEANTLMFRDPTGDTKRQIDRAVAFHPTTVIALDLLFWDVYGATDPAWREAALGAGLRELDRVLAAGAWVIVGDVPLVTTAADWMLPHEQVPDPAALAAFDAEITAWAKPRPHVLLVPIAAWTEPLRTGGTVELAPGERVDAKILLSLDGLHANSLGTWWLLDRLDHLIEAQVPGTPEGALVFKRP